jgi:hypothetical protein
VICPAARCPARIGRLGIARSRYLKRAIADAAGGPDSRKG